MSETLEKEWTSMDSQTPDSGKSIQIRKIMQFDLPVPNVSNPERLSYMDIEAKNITIEEYWRYL
jgi:hypothetical protein